MIVLGEASLSAQNSGKPLSSRGSDPNIAGELTALPRDIHAGGKGVLLPPPQEPHPALGLRHFGFGPAMKYLGTPLAKGCAVQDKWRRRIKGATG